MKQVLLLPTLCVFLFSCQSKITHDLAIPNQVSIAKGISTQQYPGTGVFIEKPNGYQFIKESNIFQKDNANFFQVKENRLTSFQTQKATIIEHNEKLVSSGEVPKEYYKKEFKLGEYDALLYYCADGRPNKDQLFLCFGDSDFSTTVIVTVAANDKTVRDEVVKMLLSAYVDKTIKTELPASAAFTLDVSGSDFLYLGNDAHMYVYTIGGKGHPMKNPYENTVMVAEYASKGDSIALKKFAEEVINGYKSNGIEIQDFKGRSLTLNGNYAYETTFNGSFNGMKNVMYQVVTGNNTASVLFTGTAYNRQDELMKQFQSVAQTLHIKPL